MMMSRSTPHAARIVWIAVTTAVVYAPSLALGLISDDFNLIESARRSTVGSLFAGQVNAYYRPLVQLSFWLEHAVWQAEAFGYHFTNFLFHLLNTILVCLIAREVLSRDSNGWFLCGLYFGLTPTHASSVLWVCGRTDLLCATFYLFSLWSFLRGVRQTSHRLMLGALLSAFFSLLCKEMALSLPAVCFTISLVLQPLSDWRSRIRGAIAATWPLFFVVAAYVGLRFLLFGSLPRSAGHETATFALLLANLPRYAISLLVPIDLEAIKPFFRAYPEALFGASTLVALFGLVVARHLARDRILLATLVCTTICLLPVVRVFSPWYLYIPSVGIAILVGRLTDLIPSLWLQRIWFRILVPVLIAAHLFGLAQAQSWASTSGQIADRVIQTLRSEVLRGGRAVVLTIPTEYRGVPVFGWIGNLSYAMRLVGHPVTVDAIVGMRISEAETNAQVDVDDTGQIHLVIPGDRDFFRLQDLEIMTGAARPAVGQVFSTQHAKINVMALSESGQPSHLKLTPRSFKLSDPNVRVFAFAGNTIREIQP